MVKKQKFKDDTVRVSAQVYEELQQLWISDKLFVEHSPLEAYHAASKLGLKTAAAWIQANASKYERGYNSGHWGLDTGRFDGNVVCRRIGIFGQTVVTNVPRSVVRGSPDGHEFGYGGSGPHDLALDILAYFCPPADRCDRIEYAKGYCSKTAWRLKQEFCKDFIVSMSEEGGTICAEVIRDWLAQRI